MTARLRQIAVVAAALSLSTVTGCGESDEPPGRKLPPGVTQTLLQQLESVGDRVAAGVAGACDDIYASAAEDGNFEPIDSALSSIPSDVDPEIRAALEQSFERLEQLVDQECEEIRAAEQQEPDPAPDEAIPDETTEKETAPEETETTPTETDTTPTAPEETPDPGETQGRGPDGLGPPGQRGGAEAPDGEGE